MEKWKDKLKRKHSLTEEDLKVLQKIGETNRFPAGTTIVHVGGTDDCIFILTTGT